VLLDLRFPLEYTEAGQVKKKTDKRKPSQDRRERILDVARALFEERGYQGATTAQIAAAAGVPEGTLFEDFRTKRDLVFAVLERDIEVYLDFLELQLRGIEGALNRIRKFIWSHLYTWRRRRFIARFLILEVRQDPGFYQSHAHDLMQRYDEDLMGLIKEGIEEGSIRADVNAEMVRNLIFGGIEQMALHWALKEEPFDVDTSTKDLCGLVFRAIQA
jgi:TetR/AcrR family fatty acid metabolism transcriptional regulator